MPNGTKIERDRLLRSDVGETVLLSADQPDVAATASAISPIEKNTKSVDGICSTRSVAPQLPPSDSRCRSIQALASPNRFAGAWSWCRLWAVCSTSERSSPRSDFRWASRSIQAFEVGVGRLVGADVLGGVDGVELDPELAVGGGDAVAVHVGQNDELVVPLEDAQRVGGVRERRPVRHGGAERLVEVRARLQLEGLGDASMHVREQLGIAQAGCGLFLPALAPGERKQPGLAGDVGGAGHPGAGVAHDQRLQRVPDPAFPVDKSSVAVEREDAVVGQSGHGVAATLTGP